MSRGAGRAPWLLDDAAEAERVSSLSVESQTPPPESDSVSPSSHVPVRVPEHVLNLIELPMLQYVRNCVCNSRRLPEYLPAEKICFQISFVSETADSYIDWHSLAGPVEGIDRRTYA